MQVILAQKWVVISAKFLVTGVSLLFLFNRFQESEIDLQVDLPPYFWLFMVLLLTLMFVNWFLEIFRWKISIEPFEKITLREAATDVLGGLALNWVVPFTIGDFVARLGAKKDKFKATTAIMVNRSVMLFLTVLIGSYGVSKLLSTTFQFSYQGLLILGVIITSVVLFRKHLSKFLSYFKEVDSKLISRIMFLSVLRYLVFVTQFFILLKLFVPFLEDSVLIAGIGWIFLLRSSIPSLLGGFGLREVSAYLFFQNLVPDISSVLMPVFLLWIINTVFPSLVGLILIWKLKFKIAR